MGKHIVNEEFLDTSSIKPIVAFTFGGHPMMLELIDGSTGRCKISKRAPGSTEYGFGFGWNPDTHKPQIGWEKGYPEDLDIRIAVDVLVAKFVYLMVEHKFDMTLLPRLK